MGAAVGAILLNAGDLRSALDALAAPSPRWVAVILLSVVGNVILSGLLFHLLTSRYGAVPRGRMLALIAATSLVNYLPLRPGLVGRAVYLKRVYGIAYLDTGKTVVQSAVITAGCGLALAGLALLLHERPGLDARFVLGGALLAPIVVGLVPMLRVWSLCALIRSVEILLWAVRYSAAFALIGRPIEPLAAIAFACVGVLATMVPLVSNGLGLREWASGLLAPALTPHALTFGVTAELVNRAAELVVVAALGIPALLWLSPSRKSPTAPSGDSSEAVKPPARRPDRPS
jgi:hypothetical protein